VIPNPTVARDNHKSGLQAVSFFSKIPKERQISEHVSATARMICEQLAVKPGAAIRR